MSGNIWHRRMAASRSLDRGNEWARACCALLRSAPRRAGIGIRGRSHRGGATLAPGSLNRRPLRGLASSMALLCALLPGLWQPAPAATIEPSGIIHTEGTSTFGYEFPSDGETNFSLRLNDDYPVRVDFAPSATSLDEFFNVRLGSKEIPALENLRIRWEKEDGLESESAPTAAEWAHFNMVVFTDRGFVESAEVNAGADFYEVDLTFTTVYVNFVQFDFLWEGFNDPRTDFSMVFQANGVPTHAPIPGAIWLLGSALLALAAGSRRSSSRS